MSLADAVTSARLKVGQTCHVPLARARLTPEDAAEFDRFLADTDTPASVLARAMTKQGTPIAADSITRHRRGDCKCP